MSASSVIGSNLGKTILLRLLRVLGSGLLGAVALGWIAGRAGPREGVVLVHVTEPDVVVTVGDQTCKVIGHRQAPLRWTLPVGRHALRMSRDGALLYAEDFALGGGEERILTAWLDPHRRGAMMAMASASGGMPTSSWAWGADTQ